MANPWYTRAFTALAGSLARSAALNNEFTRIQQGFDQIYATPTFLTVTATDGFYGPFIGPLVGNADTATKLKTARTINGVAFDGSANITVADSTKVPLSGGLMTGPLTIDVNGVAMLKLWTEKNYTDAGGSAGVKFWDANMSAYGFVGYPGGAAQFNIESEPNSDIVFATGPSERMRVSKSGGVTVSGLVKGNGGGVGLGKITTLSGTGAPSGTSPGDLVLRY